jgi:hypothetical protein
VRQIALDADGELFHLGVTCTMKVFEGLLPFKITGNVHYAVARLRTWLVDNPMTRKEFLERFAKAQHIMKFKK